MTMTRRNLCRNLIATASLGLLLPQAKAATTFKPIPTQFLAALGSPLAGSGTGAENWGLWTLDPGPRGVRRMSMVLTCPSLRRPCK